MRVGGGPYPAAELEVLVRDPLVRVLPSVNFFLTVFESLNTVLRRILICMTSRTVCWQKPRTGGMAIGIWIKSENASARALFSLLSCAYTPANRLIYLLPLVWRYVDVVGGSYPAAELEVFWFKFYHQQTFPLFFFESLNTVFKGLQWRVHVGALKATFFLNRVQA